MFKLSVALVIVLSVPAFAADEAGAGKTFVVVRTDTPPTIDGVLDDPEWLQAKVVGDLHQNSPNYRESPTEETIIRLLYDDDYLYISADLRESDPAKIIATQLIKGRGFFSDDRFWIALDTFNSKRNDYMFQVNPNSMRMDSLRENNSRQIGEWDTIWHTESAINERGWATEIAIPFKSISFDPNSDTWGVNFGRQIMHNQEFDLWTSTERQWWAADSGEMTGLEGIKQGLGLDVVPSINLIEQRDHDAGEDEFDVEPSLDVLYKITPSLSATLTINTDFSAVEVDQQQVSLDRFSLFFPEKRNFFLQDAGIFEFGNIGGFFGGGANGRPFFSRRIGLSGAGVPVGIDYGGKLTGRVGDFSVGVLGIRQEEHQELTDLVAAKELFVGRASMNVLEESSLGMIVTHGDPTSNDANTVIGTDFLFRKSDGIFGQIMTGSAWYQQSDSPGSNDENQAFGGRFQVPADRFSVNFGALEIQENFSPALGFVNRSGIRQYDATLRYRTRPISGRWREIDNQINATLVTDMDGKVLSRLVQIRPLNLNTHTGDQLSLILSQFRERVLFEFPLFGRLPIAADDYDYNRYQLRLSTGQQRPINVTVSYEDGGFFGGDRRATFLDFKWRQSAHFSLGLGFTQNDVKMPSGLDCPAPCEFTSHLGRLRTDIAFNPRWAWSNLLQYDNVSESFAINSRLRYEPEAGREMLLVLNHGSHIEPDNSFTRVESALVLKVSYTFRY